MSDNTTQRNLTIAHTLSVNLGSERSLRNVSPDDLARKKRLRALRCYSITLSHKDPGECNMLMTFFKKKGYESLAMARLSGQVIKDCAKLQPIDACGQTACSGTPSENELKEKIEKRR